MLRIVTSSSLKGGVGKTSIAVNTAGALQELGERCAVVDLDPQRSADRWAPEGLAVVTVENTRSSHAVKAKLAELAGVGTMFAILDTPPRREQTLVAAMLADVVLVPVTPSVLDIWPAAAAIGIACDAKSARDNGKPVIAMVPSQLFDNRLSIELPTDLEAFGEFVAPSIVRRTAVAEAALKGQTVTDYAPSSKAAQEFCALAQFVKLATFQSQSKRSERARRLRRRGGVVASRNQSRRPRTRSGAGQNDRGRRQPVRPSRRASASRVRIPPRRTSLRAQRAGRGHQRSSVAWALQRGPVDHRQATELQRHALHDLGVMPPGFTIRTMSTLGSGFAGT